MIILYSQKYIFYYRYRKIYPKMKRKILRVFREYPQNRFFYMQKYINITEYYIYIINYILRIF